MHYSHILIEIGSSTVRVHGIRDCRAVLLETKTLYLKEGFHALSGIFESKQGELYAYVEEIKNMYADVQVSLLGSALFRMMTPTVLEEFVSKVEEETKSTLSVVSADEERTYLRDAVVGNYSGDEPLLLLSVDGEVIDLTLMQSGNVLEEKSFGFGILDVNHTFMDINEDQKITGLHDVIDYVRGQLTPFSAGIAPRILFPMGGELMVMQALGYPLDVNTLFQDEHHPVHISSSLYYGFNEHVFSDVLLTELESRIPENPSWMHGYKAYIGIVEAISRYYGVEFVIPSDQEMIDGFVRARYCD
jgi:hypothetical protein